VYFWHSRAGGLEGWWLGIHHFWTLTGMEAKASDTVEFGVVSEFLWTVLKEKASVLLGVRLLLCHRYSSPFLG